MFRLRAFASVDSLASCFDRDYVYQGFLNVWATKAGQLKANALYYPTRVNIFALMSSKKVNNFLIRDAF